ncbi:MAG: S9 family peptidase [Alphaproteobacteria bacterium]
MTFRKGWITKHLPAALVACLPLGALAHDTPDKDMPAQQPPGALAPLAERFEPRHVFDLEWASDPRISPDGMTILYVRNGMDVMKDQRRRSLWQIHLDTGQHRPVLNDGARYGTPRWSPDGTRIAYIAARDGLPQIFVRWMDTGETLQVSNQTAAPGNLVWSPDGTLLAFTARVPAQSKPMAPMPTPPKGADWAEPPVVIDTVRYRSDGAGFQPEGYTHLFVVPADGGSPRQVTTGNYNVSGAAAWLPGSDGLIFSSNRNEDWEYDPLNTDLHEINLAEETLKTLTTRKGPDGGPVISLDGRFVAYTGFDDKGKGYHTAKIHLLDRRTGSIRVLAKTLDRSARALQWAPDNNGIYFLFDDEGMTKLAMTDRADRWTVLVSNIGGTSIGRPYASGSFTVGPRGTIATVVTDGQYPADVEVAYGGLGDSTMVRVTDLNNELLPRFDLSEAQEIRFKSGYDRRSIQGWYLTPPNFDASKTYPLILEIHGGPFANYGPRFSAEGQLYAAAGYVVLFVNPRGSTSYGAEFANLIHHNYPSQDYDDLMAGVDALVKRGLVDPDRLFVTGGSGGGVLTAWIVGKTKRFKAAVVAKPVINWQSFSLTADNYPYFTKYWFPAMPWEDPDGYWKRSPLSLVGSVSTPTMLLTGEADYRTPMSETEQYYQALKLRRVDTAMVRIPGASHSIARRPSQLIAKVNHVLAWFDRYDPAKRQSDTGQAR